MPPQKRQREEWAVTFHQTQGLRTLVDVLCNVLPNVLFRVTKGKETLLSVDTIDAQHTCMVQARLLCDTEAEDVEFCVDTSLLNNCLKNIPSHYVVEVSKAEGSADVLLRGFEEMASSFKVKYTLPTLVPEDTTRRIRDLVYDYTVEVDTSTLRQIVKHATGQLRSQVVEFSILVEEGKAVCLLVNANGDAKASFEFPTLYEKDEGDGSTVVRVSTDTTTTVDVDKMEEKYKEKFSGHYLNLFLKNMERNMIQIKLHPDKPLMMHYPLGMDHSYVCFVLAPKMED